MNPSAIYERLCCAPDLGAAARALGDATLAAMIRHLRGQAVQGGVPELVLGYLEQEAVGRFLTEQPEAEIL